MFVLIAAPPMSVAQSIRPSRIESRALPDERYKPLDVPVGKTRLEYLQHLFRANLHFVTEGMNDLVVAIDKAAGRKDHILILGETGTGKEHVAGAISYLRQQETSEPSVLSSITVDCASINPNLVENEIFGHEKGAFTDAREEKKGVLEKAHNGILFLDEIGKLSFGTQAKLLGVLQRGEFLRVGGTEQRKVNVQVIAATSMNADSLHAKAIQDVILPELYYRLSSNQVVIPAIRDRSAEAKRSLITFAVDKAPKKSVRAPQNVEFVLDEESFALLEGAPMHGNMRELLAVVQEVYSDAEYNFISTGKSIPHRVHGNSEIVAKALEKRSVETLGGESSISMEFIDSIPNNSNRDYNLKIIAMLRVVEVHSPKSQTELAKLLGINRNTAGKMLDYLQEKVCVEGASRDFYDTIRKHPLDLAKRFRKAIQVD